MQETHDSPKNTFETEEAFEILVFKTRVANEISEIKKMSFFFQYLTSLWGFDQFAVKV